MSLPTNQNQNSQNSSSTYLNNSTLDQISQNICSNSKKQNYRAKILSSNVSSNNSSHTNLSPVSPKRHLLKPLKNNINIYNSQSLHDLFSARLQRSNISKNFINQALADHLISISSKHTTFKDLTSSSFLYSNFKFKFPMLDKGLKECHKIKIKNKILSTSISSSPQNIMKNSNANTRRNSSNLFPKNSIFITNTIAERLRACSSYIKSANSARKDEGMDDLLYIKNSSSVNSINSNIVNNSGSSTNISNINNHGVCNTKENQQIHKNNININNIIKNNDTNESNTFRKFKSVKSLELNEQNSDKVYIPKMLSPKINYYPIQTHQDFAYKCMIHMKWKYLNSISTDLYNKKIGEIKEKIQSIDYDMLCLKQTKNALICYLANLEKYIIFLNTKVLSEKEKLQIINKEKNILEKERNEILDKIKHVKYSIDYCQPAINFIQKYNDGKADFDYLQNKFSSLENSSLNLLIIYQRNSVLINKLKLQLRQYNEKISENNKLNMIKYQEKSKLLEFLKKENYKLSERKLILEKSNILISKIYTRKLDYNRKFNLSDSDKLEEISRIYRYKQLLNDKKGKFIYDYSALSLICSKMLEYLLENGAEYFVFTNTNPNEKSVYDLANYNYCNGNKKFLHNNILLMLNLLEGYYDNLMNKIRLLKTNDNLNNLYHRLLEKREEKNKEKLFAEQKKTMDMLNSQIFNKILIKQNKFYFNQSRKPDYSCFEKIMKQKNKEEKIKLEKEKNEAENEGFNLLNYE